jgi:hypothetical protein
LQDITYSFNSLKYKKNNNKTGISNSLSSDEISQFVSTIKYFTDRKPSFEMV